MSNVKWLMFNGKFSESLRVTSALSAPSAVSQENLNRQGYAL
jgi:hypothetical protein